MAGLVVASMFGGVGNQLFCWATGFALAHRRGLELAVECGSFERDPHGRALVLQHLGIVERTESYNAIERIAIPALARIAQANGGQVRLPGCMVLTEPRGLLNRMLLKEHITERCYLRGYWQSQKYFEDCADEVRDAVSLRPCRELDVPADAVCVHMRSYKEVNVQLRTQLPKEYYIAAYARCRERISSPRFVIYSDDMEWAEERGMLPSEYDVGGAGHTSDCASHDLCDLVKMSRFRNIVIANSTFSWWSAFLSAPNTWVQAPAVSRGCWFSSEPIPEKWEQL